MIVPFRWRDGRVTEAVVPDPPPPSWDELVEIQAPAPSLTIPWENDPPRPAYRVVTFERRTLRNGAVEYIELQDSSEAQR